jgi:hypothetical protein
MIFEADIKECAKFLTYQKGELNLLREYLLNQTSQLFDGSISQRHQSLLKRIKSALKGTQ